MRRFRYWRDPLFLACCALYALNRGVIKPMVHAPFFQNWFNDLLLAPCALPPVLWIHRCLGLRASDDVPGLLEVLGHLAGWAALFEGLAPLIFQRSTGDPWDVAAYAAGAIVSLCWWHCQRLWA